MKRGLMLVVCLVGGGCAAQQHGAPMCGLAEFAWPSAARDFDRSATLALEASLEKIAVDDQTRARSGDTTSVGASLDELYKSSAPSGFVGHGVAALAIRLRQLDCGVRSGRINAGEAQSLYGSVLNDLRGEKLALSPTGGSAAAMPAP